MAPPLFPPTTAPGEDDEEGVDPKDPAVRKWLIDRPGPSWKEWFFDSFAKTYLVLGLFIGDAIVAAFWLEPWNPLGLLLSLLALLYLEYLLYQYLWYDPDPGPEHASRSTRRHPSEAPSKWLHPFPYGRWSETGRRRRAGIGPTASEPSTPDPHEFL